MNYTTHCEKQRFELEPKMVLHGDAIAKEHFTYWFLKEQPLMDYHHSCSSPYRNTDLNLTLTFRGELHLTCSKLFNARVQLFGVSVLNAEHAVLEQTRV